MTPAELEEFKMTYKVPSKVEFVVPSPAEGAVDTKGYGTKVAVPTQCEKSWAALSWRLLSFLRLRGGISFVIWHRALEEARLDFPDITSCEFFITHNVVRKGWHLYNLH